MQVLAKLNAAVFTVPLLLSSLLLRALDVTDHTSKRPARRTGKRVKAAIAAAATPRAAVAVQIESASDVKGKIAPDAKSMRRELAAVLDAHAGSREVFRYLAHFERRFAKNGLKTLDAMPVQRLRRALAQLEAIVSNWSNASLAELRSRMSVAVSSRDGASASAMWAPAATISKAYAARGMPMLVRAGRSVTVESPGFQVSRQVEVDDDVSISRFEAAFGEWHPSQQQAFAATALQQTVAAR